MREENSLGPGTYDPNHSGWFDAASDREAIRNGNASSPVIIKSHQKKSESNK